jgi:predicted ArsR family transcriptional regulator
VEVRTTPKRELTLELDRDNLAAIGRTTVREYAARLGISEHAAKVRLRALYDAGYAQRCALTTCKAGRQPWVYTAAQHEDEDE